MNSSQSSNATIVKCFNWRGIPKLSKFHGKWHPINESELVHCGSRSLEPLFKVKFKGHRRYTTRSHICLYKVRGNNSSSNWLSACEVCVQNVWKQHTTKEPQILHYVGGSRSLWTLRKRKLKGRRRHATHHNNCFYKPWSQKLFHNWPSVCEV